MTISNTTVKQLFTGDGATTTFAIPFTYFDESEVEVILRQSDGTEVLQAVSTNYSLTGGNPLTNVLPTDVEMLIAPAGGATPELLLVRRKSANTQETDYINTSVFPAESHEETLDRIVGQVQENLEKINRIPRMDDTSSIATPSLEDPSANAYLRWNATGTRIINSAIPTNQVVTTVNATYSVTDTDELILANANTAAFAVTVPDPTSLIGRKLTVKKTDATANAVTISPFGAELFDGAANISLANQYDFVTIVTDGTDWFITSETDT